MKSLKITFAAALLIFPAIVYAQGISQLEQFTSTTSPASAITQTVYGKAFRLSGQSSGCAQFSSNGTLTSTGGVCGTGSLTGAGTQGQAAYWTSSTAIGSVATGTLTCSAPLSCTARAVFGGSTALTIDTSGAWIGNAGTATALAANGANCSSGNSPLGVDASGAVESCFDVWTQAENTSAAYLSTVDISANTNLTAGDALTLTNDDIDFDGGATPSGDLGGTWASPSVTDDSHAHTGSTISGLDISSDTNLAGDSEIVLTNDTLSIAASIARDSELPAAVTAGDGLTRTVDDIDCDTASGSVFGCLASADWTTFNNKVGTSRALTISGTANQITSSAGALDLSADRTWTLSLPTLVIFPGNASSTQLTTTGATYFATLGGNVGIGTTSPTAKLEVVGSLVIEGGSASNIIYKSAGTSFYQMGIGGAGGFGFQTLSPSGALAQKFVLTSSVGGASFTADMETGNVVSIGTTTIGKALGIGPATPNAALEVVNITAGTRQLRLGNGDASNYWDIGREQLATGDLYFSAGANLRVTFSNGGNLVMAATNSSGGATGLCWDNSGSSIWGGCTSLRALKKNIADLSPGLSTLLKLRPVEFDWKKSGQHDLGFIAEEVEAVDTLLAEYSNGKLSGVKYNMMSSLIVKATQELNAKVDAQQKTIDALIKRIEALEKKK